MPNRFKLYYLSNLKDSFTANWIGASGKQSESKPIFILSSGRCGSTLLSSFLNTHEDVFIPKENTLILDIIKQWHSNPFESWEKKVSRLVENVRSTHNWKIDIDGLKEILLKTVPAKQNLNQLCDTLFSLSAKAFDKSATVWGDQTPANGTYMKNNESSVSREQNYFPCARPTCGLRFLLQN